MLPNPARRAAIRASSICLHRASIPRASINCVAIWWIRSSVSVSLSCNSASAATVDDHIAWTVDPEGVSSGSVLNSIIYVCGGARGITTHVYAYPIPLSRHVEDAQHWQTGNAARV